jgi:hypothetical protein
MKTNKLVSFKKLALGIALALGVTSANAAVVQMPIHDVFLSVWDATKQTSFAADLGVDLTTFVGLAGATKAYNLGAAFTSWAALGAGDILTYNVAGANQVPPAGSTVDGVMLSGELAYLPWQIGLNIPNDGNLNTMQKIVNLQVTNINTDGLGAVDSTKQSYFNNPFWGLSEGISPTANYSTTVGGGGLNQLSLQYFATNGTTTPSNSVKTIVQTLSGSFSLDLATSTLNWNSTAVTAVPVPAAVWLFLGGLMSVLGFQKRKSALAA